LKKEENKSPKGLSPEVWSEAPPRKSKENHQEHLSKLGGEEPEQKPKKSGKTIKKTGDEGDFNKENQKRLCRPHRKE